MASGQQPGGSEVTPPPEPVRSGKRFGRYRLSFEVAAGGMGTVYLARAEGPGGFEKLVALKRIHAHLAKDERFVAMFLDEARIAAQIHHPNVCGVIDFGCVDDAYYLTMPFVAGESLHRIMRAVRSRADDPLLRERFSYVAARILADVCEGLHAAHELRDPKGEPLDVVHRDVSPQNVLVGYDGGARVLDFGVASARHRLHSTATGEVKGKFAYLSPEQIDGRAIDRRADVWALGVVLYECVALRRLFARPTMAETVQAVLAGPIAPLSEAAPHASIGLEEIVFKALARDPDARYRSAREMGRDLLAWLSEEGRVVGPAEVAELMVELFPDGEAEKRAMLEDARADEEPTVLETPVAQPSPRRASNLLAVAGVALVALLAGAGGAIWLTREGEAARAEPPAGRAPNAPSARDEPPAERAPNAPSARDEPPSSEPTPENPSPEPSVAPVVEADPPERAPSDPPAERDEPRAHGRGAISIVTPGGWALVYRGNQRLGEAPGTFALPAGSHVLGIQPFGRGDIQRRRVRIAPDATARLSVPVR